MKRSSYYPSNPTMHHSIWSHIASKGCVPRTMRESHTLSKILFGIFVVGACMLLSWSVAEHIPVEAIVLLFICGALTVAFAMVFPRASWVLSMLFAVMLGVALGAMGAGVERELGEEGIGGLISEMVNVSIVVSIITLVVITLLRRLYVLSTIHRTGSIIIGALAGFFVSFVTMRVLGWTMDKEEIPLYYDTYQGYTIIFSALVAIFMSASTVYHLYMVRRYEHRCFPRYMEWYMCLVFIFSLVWFYNENLNIMLSRGDYPDENDLASPSKKHRL